MKLFRSLLTIFLFSFLTALFLSAVVFIYRDKILNYALLRTLANQKVEVTDSSTMQSSLNSILMEAISFSYENEGIKTKLSLSEIGLALDPLTQTIKQAKIEKVRINELFLTTQNIECQNSPIILNTVDLQFESNAPKQFSTTIENIDCSFSALPLQVQPFNLVVFGEKKSKETYTLTLSTKNINGAFAETPIKNLKGEITLALNQNELRILPHSIDADIFGGAIHISEGVMTAKNLSLEEILKVHPQEKVQATGRINGSIPFTLTGKKLTVQNGTISSLGDGGIIRYQGDPLTTEISQLQLAYSVLQNFNYTKLTGELRYDKNQDLLIKTHITGTSPQVTRPIELNLNIEENLGELLKSLKYVWQK